MDNTLSKWGYFIIASTLSKKREHIQIPYNSNHLLADGALHPELGRTSITERSSCSKLSTSTWFENLLLVLVLWMGKVYEERLSRWGRWNTTLGWAQATSMCWDSCAMHLNAPSGQPRGLVCIGSPVSCVASYSTWVEANHGKRQRDSEKKRGPRSRRKLGLHLSPGTLLSFKQVN